MPIFVFTAFVTTTSTCQPWAVSASFPHTHNDIMSGEKGYRDHKMDRNSPRKYV